MTRGSQVAWWLAGIALVVLLIGGIIRLLPLLGKVTKTSLTGAVLVDDHDPEKQAPIPGASVQAKIGSTSVQGTTDENGYFSLVLPRQLPNQKLTVTIKHPSYFPLEEARVDASLLCIAKLTPTLEKKPAPNNEPKLSISNARIRYTTKEEATLNVGSIVRVFEVPNEPGVPCGHETNCSPDKKWKATDTTVVYDAGDNNQFINIRASCVAGPCAFTQLEPIITVGTVRKLSLTVKNWSDPATYLVEAEVSRTMVSDMVRESYPAIFGTTMNFTLPAAAEGPSIEAELNGTSIVFPLGPNLLLSWATCTAGQATGRQRLYRCELKRGFTFR